MVTPVQPSYSDVIASGYPGQVANGELSNRISRTMDDAVGFGKAVFRGNGDRNVTGTPSADLIGITIANTAGQSDTYAQSTTAAILTQGVIWVLAGSGTTDGAQVYVGDGLPDAVGIFTSSSTGTIALSGWTFQDTVASGQPVRIAKR